MPPTGRERRRKGPINRLRRLMYGVLLLAATPGIVAADELAYFGKYHLPVAQAPERVALATLQGLLVLRAGQNDRPEMALDAVTAQVPQAGAAQSPQFQVTPTPRIDGGVTVDFDLPVADFGTFQLTLLTQPSLALSAASLGGALELVRVTGERFLAVVPQLRILELHGSETRYLPFEAALKRRRTPEAAELSFRWRI